MNRDQEVERIIRLLSSSPSPIQGPPWGPYAERIANLLYDAGLRFSDGAATGLCLRCTSLLASRETDPDAFEALRQEAAEFYELTGHLPGCPEIQQPLAAARLSDGPGLLDDRSRLSELLERERTAFVCGLTLIREEIRSRGWLRAGRGPYEWDDDRYRQEFHRAFEAIYRIVDDTERETNARSLKDCPQDRATVERVRRELVPSDGPGLPEEPTEAAVEAVLGTWDREPSGLLRAKLPLKPLIREWLRAAYAIDAPRSPTESPHYFGPDAGLRLSDGPGLSRGPSKAAIEAFREECRRRGVSTLDDVRDCLRAAYVIDAPAFPWRGAGTFRRPASMGPSPHSAQFPISSSCRAFGHITVTSLTLRVPPENPEPKTVVAGLQDYRPEARMSAPPDRAALVRELREAIEGLATASFNEGIETLHAEGEEWHRLADATEAARARVDTLLAQFEGGVVPPPAARPKIVCLCGSTRFYDAFQQANYDLTMAGRIVLSVGFYLHAQTEHGHGEGVGHDSAEKIALDELHLRKIDLADEVFVLNIDGYIGDSTRREIAYAQSRGKPIGYLVSPPAEDGTI